ncbi:MAG TPA: hypothetical protein DCQ31_04255 [Bacteroidales bacterium]|nr:hypothetical protein [Bacteroidales bacterium]
MSRIVFFIFVIVLVGILPIRSQSRTGSAIEVEFMKHKIVAESAKTIFNILKVFNPQSKPLVVTIKLNLPENWSIIGNLEQEYTLDANSTLSVPVRIAVSKQASGAIGYAVIATVSIKESKLQYNAYTYINIPKKTKLDFQLISRIGYFDSKTESTEFAYRLTNKGNINELISIEVNTSPFIEIKGEDNNVFTDLINLGPYKDTLILYQMFPTRILGVDRPEVFQASINVVTPDTLIRSSMQFKELSNSYTNLISESEYPLVIEATVNNLFSDVQPTYSMLAFGKLAFKKDYNLNYYLSNSNFEDKVNIKRNTKAYLQFTKNKHQLSIGDVTADMEHPLYGKGFYGKTTFKKFTFTGIFTEHNYRNAFGYGAKLDYDITRKTKLETSFSEYKDFDFSTDSKLFFGGFSTNFLKNQQFSLRTSFSFTDFIKTNQIKPGYGGLLNYNAKFNKLRISLFSEYGSAYYSGITKARAEIRSFSSYQITNELVLTGSYSMIKNEPITTNNIQQTTYNFNDNSTISAMYMLTNNLHLSISSILENSSTRSFYISNGDNLFETRKYSGNVALRYRFPQSEIYIRPSIKAGIGDIIRIPNSILESAIVPNIANFYFIRAGLSIQAGHFGFAGTFYSGPNTISHEFNHLFSVASPRSYQLMPYFERNLYKNSIVLSSRVTYYRDAVNNLSRLNAGTQITWYLPYDFTMEVINNILYQTSFDKISQSNYSFSTVLFELKLKKAFGPNQPRIKYHNLKIDYYRDLNGNKKQDSNEPGVSNVLASVVRNEEIESANTVYGEFQSKELLSNTDGKIRYINIPQGDYLVKFKQVSSKKDSFHPIVEELKLDIVKDTLIKIPFIESNKLFGQLVLNKDPLTNYRFLDISNIRITANDSYGNSYYTLTDANGKFELIVPNIDKYTVSVNHTLPSSFVLEQNDFIVQLNGFKQFELSFIFTEEKRKIRFSDNSDSSSKTAEEMRVVKRATFTGTLKSGADVIQASIHLFNAESNQEIGTASSDKNGEYVLTVLSAPKYRIELKKHGYWFYTDEFEAEQLTSFQTFEKSFLLEKIVLGNEIDFRYLYFGNASTELVFGARGELEALTVLLSDNPTVKLELVGSATKKEVEGGSTDIARKRAEVIAKFLTDRGVATDRLKVSGSALNEPENGDDDNKLRQVKVIILSY